MALSPVYVNPAVAGPGAGTIGDPYASIQYALDNHARDTSNGNEILVTPGTDDVLSAPLDFSTWGNFTWSAPLAIKGNGGQAGIDCDGNSCIAHTTTTPYGVMFANLRIHNSGTSTMFDKALRSSAFYACEFDNCNADCVDVEITEGHRFVACHFHNIAGVAISSNKTGLYVEGCHFANDGAYEMTDCISAVAQSSMVLRNTFSLDGATTGISADSTGSYQQVFAGNSILSVGGSGRGIYVRRGIQTFLHDNIVEGFTTGTGIEVLGSDQPPVISNSYFNNGTDYSGPSATSVQDEDSLPSSGFAKSGPDSWANRLTYFAPVDIGNVLAGPYGYRGAVPPAAGGGGGNTQAAYNRGRIDALRQLGALR